MKITIESTYHLRVDIGALLVGTLEGQRDRIRIALCGGGDRGIAEQGERYEDGGQKDGKG